MADINDMTAQWTLLVKYYCCHYYHYKCISNNNQNNLIMNAIKQKTHGSTNAKLEPSLTAQPNQCSLTSSEEFVNNNNTD